jgi:RNAse (barnase) inhibitor barstar
VLDEDVRWFEEHGYESYRFEASAWLTLDKFHLEVKVALGFPDYYGCNLDAFDDCLGDLGIPVSGGTILVFVAFDKFASAFPAQAWAILDIIAHHSRLALVHGRRLLALVQSDDPSIELRPVGATVVGWNPREWLNRDRGLKGDC